MAADTERLRHYWTEQRERFASEYTEDLGTRSGPYYRSLPREEVKRRVYPVVDLWLSALAINDGEPLRAFARQLASARAAEGIGPDELMIILDLFRERMWQLFRELYADGNWDIDMTHLADGWMHDMRSNFVLQYGQYLEKVNQQLGERERQLQSQGEIIRELSSPVVPIYEGILVMPLVGALDSRRTTQVMEATLEQIVASQAEVLILDITGVPLVDTSVANHLMQMTRAINLLGAQVVLVGIGAEIAQTMVQLEMDMSSLTTMANLEAGIAYALRQRGLSISALPR